MQQEIGSGPLTRAELVQWTETVADEVRRGQHVVRADANERWHVRLHGDHQVDIWLISWTTDQATQLHDHGGSAGAFTVVSGVLDEAIWEPADAGLRETRRGSGDTVAFGKNYVHDVRNTEVDTAVSVHAYSPPLSLMNYYDAEQGELIRLASVWTDDPEEPLPTVTAVP